MRGSFLIVVGCFCWAVGALIRYPLLEEGIDSVKIVFYEHIFLVLLLAPFSLSSWKKIRYCSFGDTLSFLVVGAGGSGLATVFFTNALFMANPSAIMLLQKLQIVFAFLLARLVLKESFKKGFLFWSFWAVVGVFLISYPDIAPLFDEKDLFSGRQNIQGYCYAIAAAAFWGSATVFGKKLGLSGHSERDIMLGRFFWGLVAVAPFVVSVSEEYFIIPLLSGTTFLKIAMMALIAGLLGVYFYYRGLRVVKARIGAVAEMSFPFFAVAMSWIFLGKELQIVQIMGGLLLITGVLMIQWKRY